MSDIISQTVIPAQPGFFRLWPYMDEAGAIVCRNDAVIAWVVTIQRHPAPYGYENRSVSSDPVTFDPTGEELLGDRQAILRPDGMVEELDQEIKPFDAWLADPDLLKRFKV